MGPEYTELKKLVRREGLHTVCEEAGCPNIYECWEDREATFLIGGEVCSRRCDFCQIDTGKPAPTRPRRTTPGRRERAGDEPAVLHRHRCGPRRPARRRRLAVRRDRARHQGAQPVHRCRAVDPRLQRRRRPAPGGLRVPARSVGPQPRNRAAHLQAHSSGLLLSAQPRRAHRGARLRPGHQEQPHPRHGRDARGGACGADRPARGRLRHRHHHPIPAPVGAPPPGRALGPPRRIRRVRGATPSNWASPGCWPVRWCVRRIGPAGSTSRPGSSAHETPTAQPG